MKLSYEDKIQIYELRQEGHSIAYLVRPLHSYSNYYTINVYDYQFC